MPGISGMISFLAQLFFELQKIRFNLLQSCRREHLRILANLLIDEGEQLTHLECDIEEFLVDELGRVCFAKLRLNALQVAL